jgi:2-amino-4-hydroxy-6-hydroxymethyldihydropteridine diphosphokinase
MTDDHLYLIALGSNQRHATYGAPSRVLLAALAELEPLAIAPIIASRPIGPSARTYANTAAIIASALLPDGLLAELKSIEQRYGRRARGQRWRARVLDLDIILWSGGIWTSPGLGVPHRDFRARRFVLAPAVRIAGEWRDPISGFNLRHLIARLDRKRSRP